MTVARAWALHGGDEAAMERMSRPGRGRRGRPYAVAMAFEGFPPSRDWPAGPVLYDRQALSLVRQTWTQLIPLCDWLSEHVGPPGQNARS